MLTSQRYEMLRTALTALIGADEQVDQNDFGASVAVTLGDGVRPVSGEFLSLMLYTWEEGTGAVQTPAGTLLILTSDPATTAGDTSITSGERLQVIGQIAVSASDWISDANGGSCCIVDQPVPIHDLTTVYLLWFHEDATSFNDGAGDDECLSCRLWYRRDT
jgi:hypothetical protein